MGESEEGEESNEGDRAVQHDYGRRCTTSGVQEHEGGERGLHGEVIHDEVYLLLLL